MARIGLDIGGTRLKAGRVEGGRVVAKDDAPTPKVFADMIAAAAELIRSLVPEGEAFCVGAGVPGVFDDDMSMVLASPNLRFLDMQPLRDSLSAALDAPVRLGNDASVATLAEALYGAGREHRDFLLATLGTGIGGGLVLDGELWQGNAGMAGEFGHTSAAGAFADPTGPSADPTGISDASAHSGGGFDIPQCGCHAYGCLETYASASRMEEYGQRLCGIDGLPDLASAARAGNANALSVFARAGKALGEGFAQVVLLLDIRVLLIGGGASPVVDLLREPFLDQVVFRCAGRTRDKIVLAPAQLGNDAGLLGAAALADERA